MQSSSVERHIDRRNGAPNQRPGGRRPKDKTNRPKPTPTDLAHAKQKRKENRDTYALALAAAQQSVWDQAEALREQFGKHDTNYYFEEIIHRSHLKVAERSVSRWNAFLSLELAHRNKGF
jgi:chromatin segregation and condensation protein Rec8/ScpA/Scc1 (kleisin family)